MPVAAALVVDVGLAVVGVGVVEVEGFETAADVEEGVEELLPREYTFRRYA